MKRPLLAILTAGSTVLLSRQPAHAGILEDANQLLDSYNLPPILYVPSGFSPLVSEFGRGNIKKGLEKQNPIIVQFCHPSPWIVQKTSVNNNGESGTIGANDYIKGDSSFLYVTPLREGDKADLTSKAYVQSILLKSLSQKGDPVESFKILSLKSNPPGPDGQPYAIAEFSYELNTEAGFLIGRKGFVSLTSVGPAVQSLVTLTTNQRYKKMGEALSDIANSFRVYKLNSGIFSGAGKTPVATPAPSN